ncbi:DNA-processing protein DprA [Biformimicrobium ophioploci]|uniref:DNA-processing protein DprA n=1 Tax=Biformimicrobium ophioploci TaxID=3036711 RepID=A0ABQ6LVC0_9GAMM|nr:DNA-processing protein DprA [Microbulbifer sp. NKW57]GMG86027.1 DNA-processing protein DprA [Microbulbifer sp. NKW57]
MDATPSLRGCMALLRLPGIGAGRFWQLIEQLGTPARVLEEFPDSARKHLRANGAELLSGWQRSGEDSTLAAKVRADLDQCAAQGIEVFCWLDDGYPPLLAEISRPPPLLYVKGSVGALHLPQVAVVGARRAGSAAQEDARVFSRELAAGGFAITSGLALGVDSCAHGGALEAGGVTVAVMGTGADLVYPARNRGLAEKILTQGGALVSEFPLGTAPDAPNFPQRNRIISGLSLGVLVVQAAVRSGSLITARLALEQGREVFAIPGSIHNPLARGCHRLIREGAHLVESSADIVEQMPAMLAYKQQELLPEAAAVHGQRLDAEQCRVLAAITGGPVSLDRIAAAAGVQAGPLLAQLVQLELAGLVSTAAAGYELTVAGQRAVAAATLA